MAFLTRYELCLELEPVSKVNTESQSVVRARKNLKGGGFPPAEIGLNCCKKLYTVRKRLVDFSLLINFTAKNLSLLC